MNKVRPTIGNNIGGNMVRQTIRVRIEKALGTTTQPANANLIAESGGLWTSDHKLSGIAYVYLRFRFNRGGVT